MVNIELSNLPYGQTLGHIANVLVGTVFFVGVGCCDPRFHSVWVGVQNTSNAWLLLALGVPALLMAYVAGLVMLTPAHIALSVVWGLGQKYTRKHNSADPSAPIPDLWKALAAAVLSRGGVQLPGDVGWEWAGVFYGLCVAENMSAQAVSYAVTFTVGLLLAAFILFYPCARTLPLAIASALAVLSVLYRVWILGRTYAEFQLSWPQQAVGMLRLLLNGAGGGDAGAKKADGKASGEDAGAKKADSKASGEDAGSQKAGGRAADV